MASSNASNGASDVLRLSKEEFIAKAAVEAGKYWDEMHGRNATISVGSEVHQARKERFAFVCAADKIDIVETSGRTHTKLVDTSPDSEDPEHFAAHFPNQELIGYASEHEHVALMLDRVQGVGGDKKMLVIMRPADEDKFDAVNTPEALKTVHNETGRIIHRYR